MVPVDRKGERTVDAGIRSHLRTAGDGEGEAERGGACDENEARELVGTTIAGRYVIEEPIGRGGLGCVFRVRHVALGKEFALKIQNADLSGEPSRREQFYKEAKLASSMIHPNIISVIDFGEDERVGAFMVMEYLDGEPLAERLRRYPRGLPVKVFCDVMKQLADALQHIHRQGVVHGDIKPDNVLCFQVAVGSGQRRRWQTKLLDFGMASLRTMEAPQAKLAGTPGYLAPERILGESAGWTADIYSLGLVGYELLTGSAAFHGSPQEVLVAQLETDVPPIPARRGEDVDDRVHTLIERAIAKDPAERHPSAEAFLYELRTVMQMLGMTERRRRVVTSAAGETADRRTRAAAIGFDRAPLPMAGVNTDGAVVVANAEFARFVTGEDTGVASREALFASPLLDLYPSFFSDLRRVFVEGRRRRHGVSVGESGGAPRVMSVVMTPGHARGFGDVHVTIVRDEDLQAEGGCAGADRP